MQKAFIKIDDGVQIIISKKENGAETPVVAALQLDLFGGDDQRKQWLIYAVKVALQLSYPFPFSRLRASVLFPPSHKNWWGALTKAMKTAGFRYEGPIRSTTPTRNGGIEGVWSR